MGEKDINIKKVEKGIQKIQEQLQALAEILKPEPKQNERIVVYASTANQFDKMETAAKSLLLSNDVDHVYFIIEEDEYPNKLPDKITPITVKKEDYFCSGGANMESYWTWIAITRLALQSILPNHDRVLWLDTDTIVMDDISELFNRDIDGYYFGAIEESDVVTEYRYMMRNRATAEITVRTDGIVMYGGYYNSGVLICNLKALRDGKGDELLRFINTTKLTNPDQDAINICCRGKILSLPVEYNSAPWTDTTNHPKIIHVSYTKHHQRKLLFENYGHLDWEWIMEQNERRHK